MSIRRRSSQALVMTVLVAQFAACGGGGSSAPAAAPPPPTTGAVASVAVTPMVATLVSLGETLQLTASASDANGNAIAGKTFAWSSSDESIATVTDSGLVTALANGPEVTITAATDGVEGTAAIEVGRRPLGRAFHAMAYDAASDRVILFGGLSAPIVFGDTWAYDFNTNSWTAMNPPTSPDARTASAMAYDAQSDRVILFGGSFQQFGTLRDTWAFDFNSNAWTDMSATPSPDARTSSNMAYDAQLDRVILFGGVMNDEPGNFTYYDETWAYDFDTNAWTQLRPSMKPSERVCFALAYDAESGRVILFGAENSGGLFDDTWAYNYNTNAWTDMNPAPRPLTQAYQAMAYDAGSDRVILFGGAGGSETWAYDFNSNTWTKMNPVVHPSGRWGHVMVYDEESKRVVLFGGGTGITPSNETWAYDFNSNTWTHMH